MSREFTDYVHVDDVYNEFIPIMEHEKELRAWVEAAAGLFQAIECLQEIIGENNECGPCQVAITKYKEILDA